MIITRKRFLKVTGISALAVAGEVLAGKFALAMEDAERSRSLTANRWAMTVDLVKCAQQEGASTRHGFEPGTGLP